MNPRWLLRAAVALLVIALGLAVAVVSTSCGPSADARDGRALVVAGFEGAVVALEICDAAEAQRIDAIQHPTAADIALAEDHVARLTRAKAALVNVRAWLTGDLSDDDGRAAMREVVETLAVLVAELRADGVKVPPRVVDALRDAYRLAAPCGGGMCPMPAPSSSTPPRPAPRASSAAPAVSI